MVRPHPGQQDRYTGTGRGPVTGEKMDRIHNITRRHKKCWKLIILIIDEGKIETFVLLIMYVSNCI